MAVALQIEPIGVEWAPRPMRLRVVEDGRPSRHVYRRRRLVVVSLLVSMIILLGLAVRAGAAVLGGAPASTPGLRPGAATPGRFGGQVLVAGGLYVVQPGDTLWNLAHALQPSGDLSAVVWKLERLNGGAELRVGERIVVPD